MLSEDKKANHKKHICAEKTTENVLPGVLETDLAGVHLGVERGVDCAERSAGGLRICWLRVFGSPGAIKKSRRVTSISY